MSEEELPPGWAKVEIKDLITPDGVFIDGDWIESKDQDPDGDVRLIQLADIGEGAFLEKSARFLTSAKAAELRCTFLKKGDVLVARMPDPLGRACIFPLEGDDRYVTVVDVCIIRTSADIASPEFLTSAINFLGTRKQMEDLQTGTTRKRISRGNLANVTIPLPPLAEQKRIVAKIEELFSELEAGEESFQVARRQLGVYRQSLLKQAVEGQLTGCQKVEQVPLRNLITGLTQGWSPKCELNRTPTLDEWAIIKTTAIQHCRYDDTEAKPLPPPFEPRSSIEIKDGDFLMTRKGPRTRAGVSCYVRKTRHRLMVCDTVYRFRCIETKVHPLYLELALNSPDVLRAIDRQKAGISESGLSLTHSKIGAVEIPLCSLPEQQEIVRLLDAQFEGIERSERELDDALRKSESLRQSILKKAFTGQLVPQDPADEPASALLARLRSRSIPQKFADDKH